jgi:YHS domain-containing protein
VKSILGRTWIAGLALSLAASLTAAALSQEQDKKNEAVNDVCPSSGKAVNPECSSEVTVKFCCDNCKAKFEKDPVPFLHKIDKEPNEKCPASGKAVKDASAAATVAFCCGKCKEKFDKEPAKFLAKIKAKKKDEKK